MQRGSNNSKNGMFIKPEPVDDQGQVNLSIPQASAPPTDEQQPLFMEPTSRQPRPKRAMQPDGERFATACCDRPHLDHPHHHLLICGHDIVTDDIVKCARNCKPGKDKGMKPKYGSFQCPVIGCAEKASVLRDLDPVTRRPKPGRVCRPSHVYGRDAVLDAQRIKEKEEGGFMARRKRSESPEAKPTMRKPKKTVDLAEELNEDLEKRSAGEREAMLSMKGPGTRKVIHGRFETQKDKLASARDAKIVKALKNVQIAPKRELRERQKKAAKATLEAGTKFELPDRELGELGQSEESQVDTNDGRRDMLARCRHCMNKIFEVRHHCFHCEEFDLCSECYLSGKCSHDQTHRFKAVQRPKIEHSRELAMFDEPPTACACKTVYDDFLVLCQKCDTEFHPGCVGQGQFAPSAYVERGDYKRLQSLQSDWDLWMEGKTTHMCDKCHTADAQAALAAQQDPTKRELRAKRDEEMKRRKELKAKHEVPKQSRKERQDARAQQLSKVLQSSDMIEPSTRSNRPTTPALGNSGRISKSANSSQIHQQTGPRLSSRQQFINSRAEAARRPDFGKALSYRPRPAGGRR